MKKIVVLTLILAALGMSLPAHAVDDRPEHMLTTVGVVVSVSVILAAAFDVPVEVDMRQSYLGQVRDDAAEYLSGGTASAALADAMSEIRAEVSKKAGVTPTDAELAAALMAIQQ